MKLGELLLKQLNRRFEADALVEMRFKSYDLKIKTDKDGNAVMLFIGKLKENGDIKGERFSRVLKLDASGAVIKDHWDNKGKVG